MQIDMILSPSNERMAQCVRNVVIPMVTITHLFQLRLLQSKMKHDPCFIARGALLQQV